MARFTLSLLGFAGLAVSQSLYTCDGLARPNWDDCDALIDQLGWSSTSTEYVENEDGGECDTMCKSFSAGGNCLFSVCFHTDVCVGASHLLLHSHYETVLKEYCKPLEAGGTYGPEDEIRFHVANDPGSTSSMLLESFAFSNKTLDNEVIEHDLTLEDMEKVFAAAAKASGNDKRQEDGDDFTLISIERNVIREGTEEQASPILSSGTEYTWSFSETKTVSVGMSTEVGVSLFEIFTASVGIETSMEESETIEEGLSFTVGDCPDEAVVYYYPLFDRYTGYWSSQETGTWDAWIPVAQGDYVAGRFITVCLG